MSAVALIVSDRDGDLAERLRRALSPVGFELSAEQYAGRDRSPAIAVWTQNSDQDERVIQAARIAHQTGKLIQVASRRGAVPSEFASDGFIDLASWRGSPRHPRFKALVQAISAVRDGNPVPPSVGYRPPRSKLLVLLRGALGLATILLGLLGFVANVGGARDFICSMSEATCRSIGLLPPATIPPVSSTRKAIEKSWGVPGCERVGQFQIRGDTLTQDWPGFTSVATIIGEGKDTLFVNDDTTRDNYSLQVEGHVLSIRKEGEQHTMTRLVRCDK